MGSSRDPLSIYRLLRKRFGFLNWWPGDTKDEIIIGAVLTQQTSWRNVEKAISNLRDAGALSIEAISSIDMKRLDRLITPSGFHRQKAARLKALSASIISEYGSLEKFLSMPTAMLRERLLSMNGIGPETADSIILYAAGRPVFVIDAYTRREMQRICGIGEAESYSWLQEYFHRELGPKTALFKDMHAQFVELGKRYCRKSPKCQDCPLGDVCMFALLKAPHKA